MIIIKNKSEIEMMKKGGHILATILDMVVKKVKPGVGTRELDQLAEDEIKLAGGWPAFKGYRRFPSTLCTCINDEVVHAPAIPNRILQDGDILSIDVGMRYPAKNGLVTDMSITVPAGKINKQAKKLLEVTKKSLDLAIKKIKPGQPLGIISNTIQTHAEKNKFSVVRELVGHGVGQKVHEEPQIPNYGAKNTGPVLQPGMTLAIEPMITIGSHEVMVGKNMQTYKTLDGLLSAHFEHTVVVTPSGCDVLTK